MIFAGTCMPTLFFLPETYAPVLLTEKAKRLRAADPVGNKDLYAEAEREDWSLNGVLHRTIYRPFEMLVLEPILVLLTVYMSLVYGLLYARELANHSVTLTVLADHHIHQFSKPSL